MEKASPMRLARSGLGYCGKAATGTKEKGAGRSRRPSEYDPLAPAESQHEILPRYGGPIDS